MSESLGARLRKQREAQHIALGAIAEQTKIKLSLLEGLERDDLSHWPSGIFRRAYIRAYAHAIGLNPDAIVREFLLVHADAEQFDAAAAIAAATDRARTGGGPPSRLRNIVGSAIESLARLRRTGAGDEPASMERVQPEMITTWSHTPLRAAAHGDGHPVNATVASGTTPADEAGGLIPPRPPEDGSPAGLPIGTAGASPTIEPAVSEAEARTSPLECESRPQAGSIPLDAAAGSDEYDGFEPDFAALAGVCTRLGRVAHGDEMQPLLHEAAGLVGATGLIVWLWDPATELLRPVLSHGYSDKVLTQLPGVPADADNATAAAYRLEQPCAIDGRRETNGALVVPLLIPSGCAGVLALELLPGATRSSDVRSAATILAALLAQLVGGQESGAQSHEELVLPLQDEHLTRPIRVNVRPDRLAREAAASANTTSPGPKYGSARGHRS